MFRRMGHLGGFSVPSQFGIIVVGVIDAKVSPYYLINSFSSSSHVTPTTVWGRVSPTETLFPILLLESVVNFSGRDFFSNEEFDHNALFHAPRYPLFAHHSSNSQTGLNRF